MRNLALYHALTLIPLIVIFGVYVYGYSGTLLFSFLLLIYAFFYRPYLDILRLKSLGLYRQQGFWKIFFVERFKYYSSLMFKK